MKWAKVEIAAEPGAAGDGLTARLLGSSSQAMGPVQPLPGLTASAVRALGARLVAEATAGNPLEPGDGAALDALAQAVFSGQIATILAALRGAGEPVLLQLLILDPGLRAFPWERLPFEGQELGRHGQVWLTRLPSELPPRPRRTRSGPLQVLVYVAAEAGVDPLRVQLATSWVAAQGAQVEVFGPGLRWERLSERLSTRPPHVLHLVCHGTAALGPEHGLHGEDLGKPGLQLGTRDEPAAWLPTHRLLGSLQPDRTFLVFLDSCLGAAQGPGGFGSSAELLTRRGVDAVVAHQWEVDTQHAAALTNSFYFALAGPLSGGDVAHSLSIARNAHPGVAGRSPVLYLGVSESRLFGLGREVEVGPRLRALFRVLGEAPLETLPNLEAHIRGALPSEHRFEGDLRFGLGLLDEVSSSGLADDGPRARLEPLVAFAWGLSREAGLAPVLAQGLEALARAWSAEDGTEALLEAPGPAGPAVLRVRVDAAPGAAATTSGLSYVAWLQRGEEIQRDEGDDLDIDEVIAATMKLCREARARWSLGPDALLLEFWVPTPLLGHAFEQAEENEGDFLPVGASLRLVLRSGSRASGSQSRDFLLARVERFTAGGRPPLEPREADDFEPADPAHAPRFLADHPPATAFTRLKDGSNGAVVLCGRPADFAGKRSLLAAVLNAGVPGVLWWREADDGGALAAAIQDQPLEALPDVVRALRGNDAPVTLILDDPPEPFPEAPAIAPSP